MRRTHPAGLNQKVKEHTQEMEFLNEAAAGKTHAEYGNKLAKNNR